MSAGRHAAAGVLLCLSSLATLCRAWHKTKKPPAEVSTFNSYCRSRTGEERRRRRDTNAINSIQISLSSPLLPSSARPWPINQIRCKTIQYQHKPLPLRIDRDQSRPRPHPRNITTSTPLPACAWMTGEAPFLRMHDCVPISSRAPAAVINGRGSLPLPGMECNRQIHHSTPSPGGFPPQPRRWLVLLEWMDGWTDGQMGWNGMGL